MSEFEFLQTYVELKRSEKCGPYQYILQPGMSNSDISRIAQCQGLVIPDELTEFYTFSYGALLWDYEILRIPEIAKLLARVRKTYRELWEDHIFLFAEVPDLGNYIGLDLNQRNPEGLLVLDCFHEVAPQEWKGICYGLRNWLIRMVEHHFEPFWL